MLENVVAVPLVWAVFARAADEARFDGSIGSKLLLMTLRMLNHALPGRAFELADRAAQ